MGHHEGFGAVGKRDPTQILTMILIPLKTLEIEAQIEASRPVRRPLWSWLFPPPSLLRPGTRVRTPPSRSNGQGQTLMGGNHPLPLRERCVKHLVFSFIYNPLPTSWVFLSLLQLGTQLTNFLCAPISAVTQGTSTSLQRTSKHSSLDCCDFSSHAVPQQYEPKCLSLPLHFLLHFQSCNPTTSPWCLSLIFLLRFDPLVLSSAIVFLALNSIFPDLLWLPLVVAVP